MAGASDSRAAVPGDGGSFAQALDVIGNRSALLILREALCGATRFGEFAQRAGISEQVTAARLREFVIHGLLEREDYRRPGQRTRQRYRLTTKGTELSPALVALMQWSDRWFDEPGGGLSSTEARSRGVPDWSSGQPRRMPASWLP
jgi:DNA-binding HxlR family transcriptional regulator